MAKFVGTFWLLVGSVFSLLLLAPSVNHIIFKCCDLGALPHPTFLRPLLNGVLFSSVTPSKPAATTAKAQSRRQLLTTALSNELDHSQQGGCHYGILPGQFDLEAPLGRRYQLLTPECQLSNLLQSYGYMPMKSAAHPEGKQLSILLLGDSVDWYTTYFICTAVLGGAMMPVMDAPWRRMQLEYCLAPGRAIQIGMMYIPGVHPTGPYFDYLKPNTMQRITQALEEFKLVFKVSAPHMVVISANFWDAGRYTVLERGVTPFNMTNRWHPLCTETKRLPDSFIHGWMANFTGTVQILKSALGQHNTLLAYHTSVMPKYHDTNGTLHSFYLGCKQYIEQLNQAGREAARRLHMHVVDLAAMTAGLVSTERLFDHHHPSIPVAMESVNLYLNIMEQHFRLLGYTSTSLTPEQAAQLKYQPPPPPPPLDLYTQYLRPPPPPPTPETMAPPPFWAGVVAQPPPPPPFRQHTTGPAGGQAVTAHSWGRKTISAGTGQGPSEVQAAAAAAAAGDDRGSGESRVSDQGSADQVSAGQGSADSATAAAGELNLKERIARLPREGAEGHGMEGGEGHWS